MGYEDVSVLFPSNVFKIDDSVGKSKFIQANLEKVSKYNNKGEKLSLGDLIEERTYVLSRCSKTSSNVGKSSFKSVSNKNKSSSSIKHVRNVVRSNSNSQNISGV